MGIRAVYFDLDGTLADTAPDMLSSLNRLRAENGLAPLGLEGVRNDISAGATFLVQKFVFDGDREKALAARKRYLDCYEATGFEATTLFGGMREALDAIVAAGGIWGVVTNKPHRYSAAIIERLGLAEHLACLICPDHVENPKPAPDPILLAMERTGLRAEECAYIGDDIRDVQASAAAKTRFVAAGWGYWTDEPQEGMDVAGSPEEMVAILYPDDAAEKHRALAAAD